MTKLVALITGSLRGIGLAAAQALGQAGFAVVLNGPVLDAELNGAADRLCAVGVALASAHCDVSDLTAHDAALRGIEAALGPLTTLVNNAGVAVLQRGDLLEVTKDSWDRCMTFNTKAMFFFSQAFAKSLL